MSPNCFERLSTLTATAWASSPVKGLRVRLAMRASVSVSMAGYMSSLVTK